MLCVGNHCKSFETLRTRVSRYFFLGARRRSGFSYHNFRRVSEKREKRESFSRANNRCSVQNVAAFFQGSFVGGPSRLSNDVSDFHRDALGSRHIFGETMILFSSNVIKIYFHPSMRILFFGGLSLADIQESHYTSLYIFFTRY